MKKIGKYITAAVLAVCLFCMTAIPSFAYTEGYFRYEITDGVLTITEYFGREEEVTVQNMIAGTPVSVIGENVFHEEEDVIIDITPAGEDKPTAEDGAITEAGDNAPAPENSSEAPAEKAPNNNTLLCVIIYAVAVIAVAAVGIIVFVKRKKK
ncbi:MAG: hypothetical protein ACI4J4_09390 [Ruminiclostridium sp.]